MKKAIIPIPLIILFAVAVWSLINYFSNTVKSPPPIEVPKQVNYSFTIQNKTNKLLNNGKLWLYAPVEKNSFQSCYSIETSVPFQLLKSKNGNQILCFAINDLPPFATRVIDLQANIAHHSIPQKIDLDNKKIYLFPEPNIESDHPDIVLLAKELKASSPVETARRIYNWVSTNIEYAGYIKNSRGALYALKYKKGDCTEFMSLFIALCRADNIPARGIGGYTCTENCILISSTYHNWAEFYINGSWLIADCQKKIFNRKNTHYIAMQIISDNRNNPMKGYSRFRFQGTGLKVKMYN